MKKSSLRQSTIIVLLLIGVACTSVYADSGTFGVKIDDRALGVLTMASENLFKQLGASDIEEDVSLKAKVIVNDVFRADYGLVGLPDMIFEARIGILKANPDRVRVDLESSYGRLQFAVTGNEALAVLPDDWLFAHVNIPDVLPDNLILPPDNGGLFTLLSLLGGVPFGSLFKPPLSATGGGSGIGFVDELDPSEVHAVVRYRGKDKTEAGVAHVVTILTTGASAYKQGMKIWVLEDSMQLYQISIEDERGTEVFVVIEAMDPGSTSNPDDFNLETSGMTEVGAEEFLAATTMKIILSPTLSSPLALDLYASSDKVARTASITISTDGLAATDNEDALKLEIQYKSQSGSWTPLKSIEYAGLAPLGHWNGVFIPDETAELGLYSFRVRYTNSQGTSSSGWLEIPDMITVTPAPPRVASTQPIAYEMKADAWAPITITFTKPMDKNSVEKNFTVVSETGKIIEGSATWDENTFIFMPSDELEFNTGYLCRLRGEALDTEGIGLDGNFDMVSDGTPYDDYIWSFVTSSAPPTLKVQWKDQLVLEGDEFRVKIMAEHMKGLHKFSFDVAFDPSVLEAQEVSTATFSSWHPRPKVITGGDAWKEVVVDNSSGVIKLSCDGTRDGGVSGAGLIATIDFVAIGVGDAALSLNNVLAQDVRGGQITPRIVVDDIQVLKYHPRDTNHDGVVDILDFVDAGSGEDGVNQLAPCAVSTSVGQNYPNPFNPETWIPYQLEKPSHVSIEIRSLAGELVRTLDLGMQDAGSFVDRAKAAHWDGTDYAGQKVSSGVYFYTIRADGFTATKKMLLCK